MTRFCWNVTPAKERHPSVGTSPLRRNVIPAKERHPSVGWGLGLGLRLQSDSSLRWNDALPLV